MKPFHTIAVPHRDILEGKLTMDVFAADLWETHLGRAPEEYKDPTTFFKRTYLTQGLMNLLGVIEKRLAGKGGDPVIQIQTPFGGGKTHALIAMYHRAREWKAKTVVIVGTAMSPQETIWGAIEKQLTGTTRKLSGNVSPGREVLREILAKNQPVLILMDEVLEYTTKAAGVSVNETTLAAQTIAFMQELTEVAGTLEKTCVVMTLPSSILEHYDEKAERLFQRLQKVAGRVEKIYTPVQENEITKVIRRRLFADVDESRARSMVSQFVDYAEREGIIPAGREPSQYRDDFLDSFPFAPEVVTVLYHRWGSYPTFQRTRGVLRLLSLVVYSLRKSSISYITTSDFDLANEEIRRELIKHIGPEYDSIIASDITASGSGSKKVDKSLGGAFRGLSLGTRSATAIFLYSFSGGLEKGTNLGEIKRSATTIDNPSAVVAEAVEQLKTSLFFLQNQSGKYFFSNKPNINRILVTKIENIKPAELVESERQLLGNQIRGKKLKVFLWPNKPKDIPDTGELKLAIKPEKDESLMRSILDFKGDTPRVNRNTIFFLCPSEVEKNAFQEQLKRKIAYEQIQVDKTINLSDDQRKELGISLKKEESSLEEALRQSYRIVYVPSKTGVKEIDMGIPTFGEDKGIDEQVYDKLRSESEISERMFPVVLKEGYLRENDYVNLRQLSDSMLRTPGERRIVNASVLEDSIKQGVVQGLFGLGELNDNQMPSCQFFKEEPIISWGENEVLIRDSICQAQKELGGVTTTGPGGAGGSAGSGQGGGVVERPLAEGRVISEVMLRFGVPRGKVSQIMGVMNFLQSKFQTLEVRLEARDGSLSEQEYANKIKEALRQLGIVPEEES